MLFQADLASPGADDDGLPRGNLFGLAMLALVDVIQGRYQKKLMAEKEKRQGTVA